jgi:putative MATE family efflux protein
MRHLHSLTEGSIARALWRFALPILSANALVSLNGAVNSIWVGRYLGEAAFTATSNVNIVMLLLIGSTSGIQTAVTILTGQSIGAGKISEAKRVVVMGAIFFVAISIGISIAGPMLSESVLTMMKTPAESFPFAKPYMRTIFLALPSLYINIFVTSVLQGAGNSKTPLQFMLLSVAIDIALNPVFIFGLGPIPRLGIAGTALATIAAQTVGVTALLFHLYRGKHPLCPDIHELFRLRDGWTIVGTLVRKGIPMSGHMFVPSLSSLLMITLVNRFGVATMAAFGASIQIWNYVQMPAAAVGMAVSAMSAQNFGARKLDRLKSIGRVGLAYSVLATACLVLAIEIINTHVFEYFIPVGSPAVQIGGHINRVVTWSCVFFAASTVLFGIMRGAGATMAPLLVAIISMLVVRFPLAAILLDSWQADAVWWALLISSVLDTVLAGMYYLYGSWQTERLEVPASVEPLGTRSRERVQDC